MRQAIPQSNHPTLCFFSLMTWVGPTLAALEVRFTIRRTSISSQLKEFGLPTATLPVTSARRQERASLQESIRLE